MIVRDNGLPLIFTGRQRGDGIGPFPRRQGDQPSSAISRSAAS